eukprot:CAMPEP_0119013544 /NCGR_PEP_ID=MMETSP1176-20130426/8503_1 /TAXON_ID=265551 /ORGANISM="Synedropsis recta cf, Strain CCMP1620" /LENGTH=670 /DNA_ID=CAMNT_0006966641 /DNA_START=67 /DNA_END=2079 /DNA_ORIENTATION=-
MYSQYQQYQQQGGTAVATQQNGMTWNGREWIQSQVYAAPSIQSTYASAVATSQPASSSDRVALYTQYYHDWKKKETEEERKAQTLYGPAVQEAQRQAAWAKYYGDQASRAAHYFHQPSGVQPELPPAPPISTAVVVPIPSPVPPQQQYQQQQQPKSESPGGLKRFVHRCLVRCKGKDELKHMQEEVQKVISQSLKNGTMHTANWDATPLIPMQGAAPSQGSQISNQYQPPSSSSQNGGYYGPSVTQVSSSVPQNGGYYGASGGQTSSSTSYYGNSSTYSSSDTYYGNTTTESKSSDYIAVQKLSNKQQKKANKVAAKQESDRLRKLKRKTDCGDSGFESSNHTLAKRANRFSGVGGIYDASNSGTTVANSLDKYMGKGLIGGACKSLDEADYEMMTVKGTCQTLEKDYLRLTAPPKPELVRPLPVLERHLQNLIDERGNKKRREYLWFCSQFKALRQDLTVQRIFDSFAVRVYETHARVALEERDLNEYNQCQTQLKELYSSLRENEEALTNRNEFLAYRIIYYVFLLGNKKYEGGSGDLFNIMLSLTPKQRNEPGIAHALKVRSAVADFDYHAFFRLLKKCPRTGLVSMMDFLVPTVRHWSLHRMCKAYRPSVPVEFVLSELGFEKDGFEHASKWLESCGCVLSQDRQTLETKDSTFRESDWKEQNSLI